MSALIQAASEFAIRSHGEQKRKYTNEPYWHHCMRVAEMVSVLNDTNEKMIAAAWLHDVIEDCGVKAETLDHLFGWTVSGYVQALTHIVDPNMNRAQRKKYDADKLAGAAADVQSIKLCDLLDNLPSIIDYDPKFARVALQEYKYLLSVMVNGDPMFWRKATDMVEVGIRTLESK